MVKNMYLKYYSEELGYFKSNFKIQKILKVKHKTLKIFVRMQFF